MTKSHPDVPSSPTRGVQAASVIGLLVGIALCVLGVGALVSPSLPITLSIALLIGGGLEIFLCLHTFRLQRMAWAFALSLNGTGVIVGLFSAAQVRDLLEVPLAVGFIPCALFAIIAFGLGISSPAFD